MDKLKKELKEFVYNALKGKENFEAYLYKPDERLSSKNYFDIAGNSSSKLSIRLDANVILGLYSDGKKTELRDKLDLPIKVEKDGTHGLVGEMEVMVPNSGYDGFVFKMDTGIRVSSLRNPEPEDAKIDAMTKIAEKTGKVLGVLISKEAISPRSRGEKAAGDSNGEKRVQNDMVSRLVEMVEASKNVVLTGAPGTGKTYTAREVAKVMVGAMVSEDASEDEKAKAKTAEKERIRYVQFHPGYDYSDFVIGMKPELIGEKGKKQVAFDWKSGVFRDFAVKAKNAYDVVKGENPPKFVFLIDEINRADLSRVFGELFSLLEEEYRYFIGEDRKPHNEKGVTLPNGDPFVIPKNLYIIGTMNDIDRSVESMDFALRRRFAWYEVTADMSEGILDAVDENGIQKVSKLDSDLLKKAMKKLNAIIDGEEFKVTDMNGSPQNCKLRLGSEYQLGGAIFAKLEKYVKRDSTRSPQKADEVAFDKLWNNHIENILLEYLRGQSNRTELVKGLKQVFDDAVKDIDKHGESGRTGDSATVDKNPATDSKSQS